MLNYLDIWTLQVEWPAVAVSLTFLTLVVTVIYNRILSFKKVSKDKEKYYAEIFELRTQFAQYQKDIQHYLEVCELCRGEVRGHHEGRTAEHVTPAMRDQINNLVADVRDIKQILMNVRQQ